MYVEVMAKRSLTMHRKIEERLYEHVLDKQAREKLQVGGSAGRWRCAPLYLQD